jgi:rRNA maturation endonuclease Nob1
MDLSDEEIKKIKEEQGKLPPIQGASFKREGKFVLECTDCGKQFVWPDNLDNPKYCPLCGEENVRE